MGIELPCLFKGASLSWVGAGAKGPPGSAGRAKASRDSGKPWLIGGVQHGLLDGDDGIDAQS